MRQAAKWVGMLLAFYLLCLLLCGIVFFSSILTHNRELAQYAIDFEKIEHPANTSSVSFNRAVGLLSGNGNHCDYFVGEMRRFTGERQELVIFYADQEVAGKSVRIEFVENGEFARLDRWSLPNGLDHPQGWLKSSTDSLNNLYVVYVLDVGYEPGFDIRCH